MNAPSASPRIEVPAWAEWLWVGGITVLFLPALALGRSLAGLDATELAIGFLMFHAALIVNDPHFAVTYILFYGKLKPRLLGHVSRAGRVRNAIAGVLVPLALLVWVGTALALESQTALGALLQLMFLLVGWHYAKQGLGVFLVLSARRGVRFTRKERGTLLAHCHAGWLFAWASPPDVGTASVVHGVYYRSLAHPPWLETACAILFGATALAATAMLWTKWRLDRTRPPIAAATGLIVSLWVWMVFSRAEPLLYYAIPALHSLQYLYFVWLVRRNEAAEQEAQLRGTVPQRLGMLAVMSVALGWILLKGTPSFLDEILVPVSVAGSPLAPLGPSPYLACFVAVVNIHHYAMDAVLWRRDNPDMRHLLGA